MATPTVSKIVLGELTLPILTDTKLSQELAARLDLNQDGMVTTADVPDEQVKTPYDQAVHGTKEDILLRTVANTFVAAGAITEKQKRAFTHLPAVYASVKRFNAVGTDWLNTSRDCRFFSCRTFEPKAWQAVLSQITSGATPFEINGTSREIGQGFLFSLFYVLQGFTAETPYYNANFGPFCGEYSAVYYNPTSIPTVLQSTFAEITQLYTPVAAAFAESASRGNRLTLECKGDCTDFPVNSLKLVYPFKLATSDKNSTTIGSCPD